MFLIDVVLEILMIFRKISRIWFNPTWILAFQIKKRQPDALSSRYARVQGRPDYKGFLSKIHKNMKIYGVHKATKCDEKNENNSPKKRSKAAEKWNKSRNMVFSMDKESCLDVPGLGGVSNLVRKWKDFENSEFMGSPQKGFDECDESSCSIVKSESFGDLESDKIEICKDCDVKESERLGVADIIKKLTFDNGNVVVVANGGLLPRVRTSMMDHSEGQRCNFPPVLSLPRFIRGRQAFSDLLLQMERDRQRELEGLVERKAVSKFQQRGHIQAVLRVRLIRRGAEVRGGRSLNCPASESSKSTKSAIMQLR